jgi:hypothetical protein
MISYANSSIRSVRLYSHEIVASSTLGERGHIASCSRHVAANLSRARAAQDERIAQILAATKPAGNMPDGASRMLALPLLLLLLLRLLLSHSVLFRRLGCERKSRRHRFEKIYRILCAR